MKNNIPTPPNRTRSALAGAAFLMATSAIGPGFLNNTSLFTAQLLGSFGFVILVSILIDIGAQLNIWRIVSAGGQRAQDLANGVIPGAGSLLAVLVALGGLVFNVGNLAGCGLGLDILTGMNMRIGALGSAALALFLFWHRAAGRLIDRFVQLLGLGMLLFTGYVMVTAGPDYGEALEGTFWPQQVDVKTIVAVVGGTVGGYISFAGAHRLLESGLTGPGQLPAVNRGAVRGILLTSLMRYLLFLAALGVISSGVKLETGNPAADVFRHAAGRLGYLFFGIVLWSAAITSVVGATFTSVSFIKTLHPLLARREKWLVTLFILISLGTLLIWQQPPSGILVTAGWINGLILPLALALLLPALRKKELFPGYRHPAWLWVAGWMVVLLLGGMSLYAIVKQG